MTNTGGSALQVKVIDDNGTPGDTSDDFDVVASNGGSPTGDPNNPVFVEIAPGDTETFTVTIPVSGEVTNVVTASGGAQQGIEDVSDTDTATVTVESCAIAVTKTPDRTNVCTQGDSVVNYTIEITNPGSVPLENVTAEDDNAGLAAPEDVCADEFPGGLTIAAGGSVTCNHSN